MKISELINALNAQLQDSGDLEVVVPLENGEQALLSFISIQPIFDRRVKETDAVSPDTHVAVLSWWHQT